MYQSITLDPFACQCHHSSTAPPATRIESVRGCSFVYHAHTHSELFSGAVAQSAATASELHVRSVDEQQEPRLVMRIVSARIGVCIHTTCSVVSATTRIASSSSNTHKRTLGRMGPTGRSLRLNRMLPGRTDGGSITGQRRHVPRSLLASGTRTQRLRRIAGACCGFQCPRPSARASAGRRCA